MEYKMMYSEKHSTETSLDPQCRAMLDAIRENGSPFDTDDAVEARRIIAKMTKPLPNGDPRFSVVKDGSFPGPDGAVSYRYYRPMGVSMNDAPCLIYFHGGGMVFGTLDSHDPVCREVSIRASCVVFSVDYRLAPENKFPAAVMDGWASFEGVVNQSKSFGVDPDRIAVGGDSAGGNLSAVISLIARDNGGAQPCLQWLIYPNTDMTHPDTAPKGGTLERFANGYFLTRKGLVWLQDMYLNTDKERFDWRASPIKAEKLEGVAPAFVQTAGFDPLKDQGVAYASRLESEGVKTKLIDYPGMIHGFIRGIGVIGAAETAVDDGVTALKDSFVA